jgi:hypothetical protein
MKTRAGSPELKEFGAHRSGTNFLRVILQENYEVSVLTNTGGWKHGYYEVPKHLGREVDCAICIKDPYAWITSYYNFRNPKKETPFSEYVRKPAIFEGAGQRIECPNPMQFWVRMNEHWLDLKLKERRKFVFRYENVLADPIGSVQELVRSLGLKRRLPRLHKIKRAVGLAGAEPEFFLPSIRLGAVPQNYKNSHIKHGESFDAGRYTERKYLALFDPASLDFINEQLDKPVLAQLGYPIICPEDLKKGKQTESPSAVSSRTH